jgi:mannosyltransferase OCH1-like enzyme
LDTNCIVPAKEWLKEYSFVAAVETPHGTVGNFTFASEPKHPILYNCLEQLLKNYNDPNYLDKIKKTGTPIQNYGANAFHVGVSKNLNLNNIKIYTYDDNAFTPNPTEKSFVQHLTGSVFWDNNVYDSWKQQQKNDFGIEI